MRSSVTIEGIMVGVAASVVGIMLTPVLKPRLQFLGNTLGEGFAAMSQNLRKWVETAREEMEDIVKDAQFERMKRSIDRELRTQP